MNNRGLTCLSHLNSLGNTLKSPSWAYPERKLSSIISPLAAKPKVGWLLITSPSQLQEHWSDSTDSSLLQKSTGKPKAPGRCTSGSEKPQQDNMDRRFGYKSPTKGKEAGGDKWPWKILSRALRDGILPCTTPACPAQMGCCQSRAIISVISNSTALINLSY